MPIHDPACTCLFAHADLVADPISGFVRGDWATDPIEAAGSS